MGIPNLCGRHISIGPQREHNDATAAPVRVVGRGGDVGVVLGALGRARAALLPERVPRQGCFGQRRETLPEGDAVEDAEILPVWIDAPCLGLRHKGPSMNDATHCDKT